jgi:enoyl-CoA hydratase
MAPHSPSSPPPLLHEREGAVLVLTLNRPERMNAVSADLYRALDDALAAGHEDADLRAVVLTGAGRAFSVGADLRAHGEAPPDAEARRAYVALAQRANQRLQTLARPVVAAVNGHAVGAGFELALSCDFVVMAREAKLRLPEAALGTFVGGGVTRTLARRVGDLRARELLMCCPFVLGEDAERWGLANRVVAADDVLPTALGIAADLARRAPLSLALLKDLLRAAPGLTLDEVLRLEAEALLQCMDTEDWTEGVRAFHERREPRFLGR